MNKEPSELSLDDLDRVSGSGDDFGMGAALQLASAQLELKSSQTKALEGSSGSISQAQVSKPMATPRLR